MRTILNQIKSAQNKQVLIIGDVMLDQYIFGSVKRISPEAPVPIVKEEKTEWSLGGAANVAANCSKVGSVVHLASAIGADAEGRTLLDLLKQQQIGTENLIKIFSRKTTVKKRIMAGHQQLLRIDNEDTMPLPALDRNRLLSHIKELVPLSAVTIISDYAKGVIDRDLVQAVVASARKAGKIVIMDPKGPAFDTYEGAHFLKPNQKEFNQMIDFFRLDPHEKDADNARKLCHILGLEGLFITRGERGITFVSSRQHLHVPAVRREVYDLTGAGDTVLAFLALGLASNLSMHQCLLIANHAASIAISHLKTHPVSLEALLTDGTDSAGKYVSDWRRLKMELDWFRVERKRIVFTNGCFDLLHKGHTYVLAEAKKQGDILVVGLNSDNSVQRLKGGGRPIKNLQERASVMAAMGAVDFVTSFDHDTPHQLIEYLKPDVVVKGGDYKKEEIVGFDVVRAYGGEVVVVDYKEGHSTSGFIKNFEGKQGQPSF